jgi:Mn-containing catalase
MNFESKNDVLQWYEKQPRTLTPEFLTTIPWHEVRNFEIPSRLIPVLLYMRDVETLTDMYYRELRRTPTGRDPVISKFMERWGTEELVHGEILNRFLHEAGVEVDESWQAQVQRAVSSFYTVNAFFISSITNLVGSKFTATHMTFGAIHEMTTAQGYRRLAEMANHPVLSMILKAIIREESAHTQFYWSVARLELQHSEFARKVARFAIQHFWNPVGQGSKPKEQTEYTVSTLFGDESGLEKLDKTITKRVQQLPGFADLTRITERMNEICSESLNRMRSAEA